MSELNGGISKFWKSNSRVIIAILSFLLPIFVYIFATRAFTPNFNQAFTRGINIESEQIQQLQELYNDSAITSRPSVIREIIANYIDLFALIAFGFKGKAIFNLLYAGHIIKLGLSGLSSYLMLRLTICTDKKASLLLSLSYAISSVALSYGQLASLHNFIVLLPIVIIFIDRYFRRPQITSFIRLTCATIILLLSGAYGDISGFPFVLSVGLFLALCRYKSFKKLLVDMGGVIISSILALMLSAAVVVPRFAKADWASKPETHSANYKALDFITTMFDGKAPSLISGNTAILTLGMFTIMLVILALINPLIPYRLKVFIIIATAFTHIMTAYPLLNQYIDLVDGEGFNGSKMAVLAVMLIFMAGISYKNLTAINYHHIYVMIAVLLGLIMISNNSLQETSPTVFALYFSAGAVIVLSVLLINVTKGKYIYSYAIIALAILELILNLHQVAPKTITGYNELKGYNPGISIETPKVDQQEGVMDCPLFGDNEGYQYLLVSSDLSGINSLSIPEAINAASRAALLNNVYEPAEKSIIHMNGITEAGGDFYNVTEIGRQCEMIWRIDVDPASDYYFSSSLNERVYLTESDYESDRLSTYGNPFLHHVVINNDYIDIRYATTPNQVAVANIAIWEANRDALITLNSVINNFDGKTIEGGAYKWFLESSGTKTVLTSLKYDSNLVVTVAGRPAKSFDYCGLLAIRVEGNGTGIMPEIRIEANSTDYVMGLVVSIIGITLLGVITYIDFKSKKTIKENPSDIQENN